MAKPNRGGKRVAAATSSSFGGGGGIASFASMQQAGAAAQQPQQQAQQQPPLQQTIPPVAPAPSLSATFNQFMAMSDDQKADVISKTLKQGVPVHLNNNDFQKFIYNLGLNDKPNVVDDTSFSKLPGAVLYRTVDKVYDDVTDISFSAPQIAHQVMGGSVTRVSSGNRAVYGSGIYFANSRSASTLYGRDTGIIKNTCVMEAKLNSNAKVISYDSALRAARHEINSGSKLGRSLSRVQSDSVASIYAVSKGYNVMTSAGGYFNVLNRTAITMNKRITAK